MSSLEIHHVDCRGRQAVVEVGGKGPDVLFVGTAAPMAWTRAAAEALIRRGFRVTNFDYGSDHPSPEYRSAVDQVDDATAVMDAMGIASPVVVGFSRGGITAYGLAGRRPDQIAALVLVMPVAPFADTMNIAEAPPEQRSGESDEDFMRRSLSQVFSDAFLADRYEAAVSLAVTSPGSVARLERHEEKTIPESEVVDCRVLVIEGGADRIVTTDHPRRYSEAIAGAVHVVIPDAPHGWTMEQPEELARLIADFVSS